MQGYGQQRAMHRCKSKAVAGLNWTAQNRTLHLFSDAAVTVWWVWLGNLFIFFRSEPPLQVLACLVQNQMAAMTRDRLAATLHWLSPRSCNTDKQHLGLSLKAPGSNYVKTKKHRINQPTKPTVINDATNQLVNEIKSWSLLQPH